MDKRKVIDDLGIWLCTDMERDLVKSVEGSCPHGMETWANSEKMAWIKAVGDKIKFYRDHVV